MRRVFGDDAMMRQWIEIIEWRDVGQMEERHGPCGMQRQGNKCGVRWCHVVQISTGLETMWIRVCAPLRDTSTRNPQQGCGFL
jgi:hypothetical protein